VLFAHSRDFGNQRCRQIERQGRSGLLFGGWGMSVWKQIRNLEWRRT